MDPISYLARQLYLAISIIALDFGVLIKVAAGAFVKSIIISKQILK